MKNSLLAAAALVVAAAVFVWWSSNSPDPAVAAQTGSTAPEAVQPTAEELAASGAEVVHDEAGLRTEGNPAIEALDATAPETSLAPGSDFTWLGRVTDVDGRPLNGVRIGLGSSPFDSLGTDRHALLRTFDSDPQAITDAEGRFRFSGPVRERHWRFLWALPEGPEYLVLLDQCADGATADDPWRATPVAGVTELEDVVLRPAGWLTGRVVDEIGQPLEGAFVKLGHRSTSYRDANLGSTTGADGTFLLGHLPAGDFVFTALLEGRVKAQRDGVRVTLGRGSDLGDLELTPAFPIEGWVRDPEGLPIADAKVRAWGDDTPSFGETESGPDGAFRVFVETPEPHRFEVSAKGYRTYGSSGSRDRFDPDGPPVNIRLQPQRNVTFKVVDSRSGNALDRFGLMVLEGMGSENTERTLTMWGSGNVKDYPGGETVEAAFPGMDQVDVNAPGYNPFKRDVALDPGTTDRMTIALDPLFDEPWAVTGRIVGAPAGTPFHLAKLRRPRATWRFDMEQRAQNLEERFGWMLERGGRLESTTTADGSFRINNPGSGEFRLFCDLGETCASSEPFFLSTGEDTNLGNLGIVEWAALSGSVTPPHGVDPTELTLYLHGQGREIHPDSSGRFEVERLYPGDEHLSVDGVAGSLVAPFPLPVRLVPGDGNQVSWNLSQGAVTTVEVEVRLNGEPAPKRQVRLSPAGDFGPSMLTGSTDENGRLTCDAPDVGELSASIRLFDFRWSEPAAQLVLPTTDLQVIDFPVTEVSLRLPEDLVLEEGDRVTARVTRGESRTTRISRLAVTTTESGARLARLGDVAAGELHLEVEVARPSESGGAQDSILGQPAMEVVEGTFAEFELEIAEPGKLVLDWAEGRP